MSFLRDIQSLHRRNLETTPEQEECQICDGYGHIVSETDVRICDCLKGKQLEKRLAKSNIPTRYRSKSLENFKADVDDRRLAVRQVRRFVQEFDLATECPGLFLYGAPGTGKTHLAIGALRELVSRGRTGLFYNMVSLIQDFRKQAVGGLTDEESDRLGRLAEVDVLVLDDLGAGRLNDFVQEQTYSLIDKRYSNNQCVIVTSNLGLRKLEEQVTYPVLSRVRGMCFTVPTGELDFRNPDLTPSGKR